VPWARVLARVNSAPTTEDDALLRAVLANPADDAPRLIYADWLDERGDPRGEYLRVDWEAAREAKSGPVPTGTLDRLANLRSRIAANWVINVSVGPSAWVRQIVHDQSGPPFDRVAVAPLAWSDAEAALNHLGRCLFISAWLVGPERWGPRSEEFMAILGGEGQTGEMVFEVGGRLGGESQRPLDRHDGASINPVHGIGEGYRIRALDLVMRAAKWAYFMGTFWPGLVGYHTND
jgi:uncharacterized protein (TIGR02996 family)